MSVWKRAMDYLGLGDEDAYADYEDPYESDPRDRVRSGERQRHDEADLRPVGARSVGRSESTRSSFPLSATDDSGVQLRPQGGAGRTGSVVKPIVAVPAGEPSTVRPRRFDQAQEVADRFKSGQSVIMNLEGADRDVSRRLIDFASGLCYALDGAMEKVATGVYLLKPAGSRGDDSRAHEYDPRA